MRISEKLTHYEISNEYWTVIAEYIGEGFGGDYDDGDPQDLPLMRYDFYRTSNNPGPDLYGESYEDSYCTLMPITNPSAVMGMAKIFLDTLNSHTIFLKHEIRRLTHTTPDEAVMANSKFNASR